jgi:hypothetical protein
MLCCVALLCGQPQRTEDCTTYNAEKLLMYEAGGLWRVTERLESGYEGGLSFFQTQADAEKLVALVRQFPTRCFINRFTRAGKPDVFVIWYWKSREGKLAPAPTAMAGEDCVRYDPAKLRMESAPAGTFRINDGGRFAVPAATSAEAQRLLGIARQHHSLCFLGRNGSSSFGGPGIVQYWR